MRAPAAVGRAGPAAGAGGGASGDRRRPGARVDVPASVARRWAVTLFVPALWIGFAEAVRRRFARPLQTLANLIASLRVGDFSARARVFNPEDPARAGGSGAEPAHGPAAPRTVGGDGGAALLRAVLSNLDVVVIALDHHERIQFANRAAEELLRVPADALAGAGGARAGAGRVAGRGDAGHGGAHLSRRQRPMGPAPGPLSAGRRAAPAAGAVRTWGACCGRRSARRGAG